MNSNLKIAYFGGEPLGVPVLEELESAGIVPSLIVCNPDRPVGRKQKLTPPPVKVWANKRNIEVFQPNEITNLSENTPLTNQKFDLFVVVAYNKILPKWLIELPAHKTINVHPSLLPLLRGASPIRSTILNDMKDECGVTIMLMDQKMDHGPILAQMIMQIEQKNWPIAGRELDEALAHMGGALLAATIPEYINGDIEPQEQDHEASTHCGRLDRSAGELALDPHNLPSGSDAYQALLKIRAFDGFPGTFFMYEGKRVKITNAQITEGNLCISQVIPEGKKEMIYKDFLNSIRD